MNTDTLNALRSSLAQLRTLDVDVAGVFYARLFELAPGVRSLFKTDMLEQRQKLMAALARIVATADRPGELSDSLARMGKQHASYGARPEHYDVVGAALLWTFERVLGTGFTPQVRAAWTEAYGVVAHVMRSAAAA